MVFALDASVTTRPKSTESGFATVDIVTKGKMSMVGFLADGTKVTASLLPDAEANYRLYALPNKGRLDSYCADWFEPQAHPDLPGRGLIILEDNLSSTGPRRPKMRTPTTVAAFSSQLVGSPWTHGGRLPRSPLSSLWLSDSP